MSNNLNDSITILIILLFFISILLIIALSFLQSKIRGVSSNGHTNKIEKIANDNYAIRANILALLILVGLTYIEFFNLFRNNANLSKALSILLTAFGGSFLIIILALLPIIRVSENHYEKILLRFSKFITIIKYLLIPFVFVYTVIVDKIYKPKKKHMTEDELLVMVERAEQEFGINENESRLIKSVLDFDELKVLDIYTPRVDLVAIEMDTNQDDIIKAFRESGFSRLPVYEDSLDNIVGILNHKDYYNKVVLEKMELKDVLLKPLEVTEYMDLTSILALLKRNQEHLAVVKDEYGGTLGIVTMEDILEELVGDIWDEHDNVVEAVQLIEDNKYLVHGSTYLTDLVEKLDLEDMDNEDYITVNGWITAQLGKIGVPGDHFIYNNLDVKVITASQKKVFEVIITIIEVDEEED